MARRASAARPSTPRGDYNAYVFRDGRLVGEFERMYRESAVVPWHQDVMVRSWRADVALRLLRLRAPYRRALDVGCGLGYFTNRVARLSASTLGVDVSATAIARARVMFPQVRFRAADIRTRLSGLPRYDLVVLKEIFWYVFPRLSRVIANVRALTAPGGTLFICQSFPNLRRRFIGRDVIPNPDRLLAYFANDFTVEHTCACQEYSRAQDGPVFMELLRRR